MNKFKIIITKGVIPETVEVKNSTGGFLAINPSDDTIGIFKKLKKTLNESGQPITINAAPKGN